MLCAVLACSAAFWKISSSVLPQATKSQSAQTSLQLSLFSMFNTSFGSVCTVFNVTSVYNYNIMAVYERNKDGTKKTWLAVERDRSICGFSIQSSKTFPDEGCGRGLRDRGQEICVENEKREIDNRADDYVAKPFSPRELVAQLKAVLMRGRLVTGKDKK